MFFFVGPKTLLWTLSVDDSHTDNGAITNRLPGITRLGQISESRHLFLSYLLMGKESIYEVFWGGYISWRDAMNMYLFGSFGGVELVIQQEIFDYFLCAIE